MAKLIGHESDLFERTLCAQIFDQEMDCFKREIQFPENTVVLNPEEAALFLSHQKVFFFLVFIPTPLG